MAEGHFLMGQWASKSKEPGPVTRASEWEEAEGWIGARACWAEWESVVQAQARGAGVGCEQGQ